MKATPRLKLTLGQIITHYSLVFLFLIPTILSFIFIIKYHLGMYRGQSDIEIWPFIFFLNTVVLLYIIQYHRLYFKKIKIIYTESQFKEAIRRTVEKLEWHIEKNSKKMFQATRNDVVGALLGELVTIVRGDGYILINSICDPNKWTNILPFRNKENVRVFLKNLQDVIDGVPYAQQVDIVENEWSFKRILWRVVLYPFCVLGIIGGIIMIYYHITLRNALAGTALVALALAILYVDIKLWLKYKKK